MFLLFSLRDLVGLRVHRARQPGYRVLAGPRPLILLFPLAFISNAMVPTQHMPAVVQTIADWNPVSAVTAASRKLFDNPNPSASVHAWPMQHPVLAAVIWSLVILVVFAPLAARLYRTRTSD